MWLQLTAVAALAGGSVGTRVDLYDDGEVTAWMPHVGAGYEDAAAKVDGGYGVDVVSGATRAWMVDTVSGATRFEDVRHAADLSVTLTPQPEVGLGGSMRVSSESDYLSRSGGLHGRVELFDRMSAVDVGWALTVDDAGRRGEPLDARSVSHDLDVSWDQIAGPHTRVAALLYGGVSRCDETLGCVASPYRYVGVSLDEGAVALPERVPAEQVRGAAALRLSQTVGATGAVKGGYRFYADSWRILGHTADLGGTVTLLDDRALVELRGRLATQSAASFYRDDYVAEDGFADLPAYRSADRELAGLDSAAVTVRAEWTWHNVGKLVALRPSLRLTRVGWRYPEFSELPTRAAWVVGGGLDAEL